MVSNADFVQLYNLAQSFGEVRFLSPEDTSLTLDIVIIPPGPGIYADLPCFIHGEYVGLPTRPMCPFIERFRTTRLDKLIEAEIHVIGVGDAAAILYSLLGGKVGISSTGLLLLRDENPSISTIGPVDFIIKGFQSKNIAGFDNLHDGLLSNTIRAIKYSILQEVKLTKENIDDNVELDGNLAM